MSLHERHTTLLCGSISGRDVTSYVTSGFLVEHFQWHEQLHES